MNTDEQKILLGILRDEAAIIAEGPPPEWARYKDDERRRYEMAVVGMVPTSPTRWIGRVQTPSERQRFHRTCKRLEKRGLIVRWQMEYSPDRTSCLELSPEGRLLATTLIAAEVPTDG